MKELHFCENSFAIDYSLECTNVGMQSYAPRDTDALICIMQELVSMGVAACIRGGGCSTSGRSISASTQIRMDHIARLRIEGGELIAEGGASLKALVSLLHAYGAWLPVIPSSPNATVGGVLAAGGFGPASLRRGGIFTSLREVTIASPRRGVLRASAEDDPDGLFALLPGSLGSLGPIVEARFALERESPALALEVCAETKPLSAIAGALIAGEAQAALLASRDLYTWRCESFVEVRGLRQASIDLHRHLHARETTFQSAEMRWLKAVGLSLSQVVRVWVDFIVPLAHVDELATAFRKHASDAAVFQVFNAMAFSPESTALCAPFPLSPVAGWGAMVSLGTYATVPRTVAPSFRSRIDLLREMALDMGGRQYLHGYRSARLSFHEHQFGPEALARLDVARRKLGVFQLFEGI